MNRMFPEVYEALRSANVPENKAVNGAVRLTEAVLALDAGQSTHVVSHEARQGAATEPGFDALSANLASIRKEMRINTWMLAVSLVLTIITCIKVYAG